MLCALDQILFSQFQIRPYPFLARRDDCPESYCRTPGVGVSVLVFLHKNFNFNLAYNSWTTIGSAVVHSILHVELDTKLKQLDHVYSI